MANELTIGFVNSTKIQIIENENGEKLVPIKPICEALGIDAKAQRDRIKEDPILSSTGVLSPSVATDGKIREMQCLPIKYVFGWLFMIDARNVKEEARAAVIEYKSMCYDVLYNYFTGFMDFVLQRQEVINEQLELQRNAKINFRQAKDVLAKVERDLQLCSAQKGDIDDMLKSLKWIFDEAVYFGNGDIKEKYRTHLYNINELITTLKGIQAGY